MNFVFFQWKLLQVKIIMLHKLLSIYVEMYSFDGLCLVLIFVKQKKNVMYNFNFVQINDAKTIERKWMQIFI